MVTNGSECSSSLRRKMISPEGNSTISRNDADIINDTETKILTIKRDVPGESMNVELPNPCAVNILKKEPAPSAVSPRGLLYHSGYCLTIRRTTTLMEKYNRKKLLVNNKAKIKQQDSKVLLNAPGGITLATIWTGVFWSVSHASFPLRKWHSSQSPYHPAQT